MRKLKPREVKQLAWYLMQLLRPIVIAKRGHRTISSPMCLSRMVLFPIKKQNLFLLYLNLGRTF